MGALLFDLRYEDLEYVLFDVFASRLHFTVGKEFQFRRTLLYRRPSTFYFMSKKDAKKAIAVARS